MGVPVIGCSCSVCSSNDLHNKRLRPSGLLQIKEKNFLIDVGPDFREQVLHYGIEHLDGILFTHSHFDHTAGFDDLKAFYYMQKKPVPILLSQETFADLKLRFHYLIDGASAKFFDFQLLPSNFGFFVFEGIEWHYMSYFQMGMKVTGFRYRDFAYISDIRDEVEPVITALHGVKTLVLSALRERPSEAHFSLDEAIAFSRAVKASATWLTHITHELDATKTNQKLPPEIQLSYDGLRINL